MPRPSDEAAHSKRSGNEETHYDANWEVVGHTKHDGTNETHYDKNWTTTGHTKRRGDEEDHYDSNWELTGHTKYSGEKETHYDSSWNVIGHTARTTGERTHYDKNWNFRRSPLPAKTSSLSREGGGGFDFPDIPGADVVGIVVFVLIVAVAMVLFITLFPFLPFVFLFSSARTRLTLWKIFGIPFCFYGSGLIFAAVILHYGEFLSSLRGTTLGTFTEYSLRGSGFLIIAFTAWAYIKIKKYLKIKVEERYGV